MPLLSMCSIVLLRGNKGWSMLQSAAFRLTLILNIYCGELTDEKFILYLKAKGIDTVKGLK